VEQVEIPGPEERFRIFGAFWRAFIDLLESLTEIFGVFFRLLGTVGRTFSSPGIIWREFARQLYFIGARGWPVVALTALLLGLAIIVYASAQLQKIRAEQLIGNLLVIIVVRELGPVFTALLVLLRSGAAMIVEIGGMVIDREIESLELMGVEPIIFIGAPRFWGLIISLGILYFIFLISAVLGGYLFGQLFADIYWQKLWLSFLSALAWQDIVISGGKILLFGMSIGTVAVYYGFRSRGHWDSIVAQTSQGAVISLLFLGIINAFLSILGYN
jgi:phospholipid/cholesterol/gamma-HCH transport system permease protein